MSVSRLSVFRRSNGIYYVRVEINGQLLWRSTRCRSRRDALRRVPQLRDLFKPRQPRLSLAQFAAEYEAYAALRLSARTLSGYMDALKGLQRFVGDLPLCSITPRLADAFISERARKVRPATVNIELRSLRAIFSVAKKWGYLELNPMQDARALSERERPVRFFSKDEFERVLNLVKEGWLRDLIMFSVSTGMRCGEILNLRWQDVDLGRRLIDIQCSSTFTTKCGKRRTIPMNELVHALLVRKSHELTDGFVFQKRNRQVGCSYLSHLFKHYVRLANLDDGLHFHSLRHTHASWLAQDGVSLFAIQKLLGHSSSAVTQIYAHLAASELHGAVNKISFDQPPINAPDT